MKRELKKLTVLMTAPILLSLVWNIHSSDNAPSKTARPDIISVPHTVQLDSLHWRSLIPERYTFRYKSNTRDLLLRPADKAAYTTSDLLLSPGDNINSIFISHHPTRRHSATTPQH